MRRPRAGGSGEGSGERCAVPGVRLKAKVLEANYSPRAGNPTPLSQRRARGPERARQGRD